MKDRAQDGADADARRNDRRQIQLIQEFQPSPARRHRTDIFSAEPWTEEMRHKLERQLGVDTVDIYDLFRDGGTRCGTGMRRDESRSPRK
jgi:hypothetical protein